MLHNCGAAARRAESALYRLQDEMNALTRSVLQHGGHVVGFKIRIVRDDFVATGTRSKQIQHITHTHEHATNAWATTTLLRAERDAIQDVWGLCGHEQIICQLSLDCRGHGCEPESSAPGLVIECSAKHKLPKPDVN